MTPRRLTRFGVIFGVLLSFLAVAAGVSPLGAADFRGGDEVIVAANEVIEDDLYVAGETIRIEGTVRGDVIAAGQQVIISGTVEGDLMACGQAVVVTGRVADDIRMAGMALQLGEGATVGDDVIAAGFSLEAEGGSRVDGGLTMAGFQTALGGSIGDGAQFAGVGLEITGRITGDVDAEVDASVEAPPFMRFMPAPIPLPTVALGLTVADDAEIQGNLTYESSGEGQISPSAVITGDLVRNAPGPGEVEAAGRAAVVLPTLQRFLALLVVGLILVWAVPDALRQMADRVTARPLATAGWGLGTLLGAVVAVMVVVLVSVVLAILTGLLSLSSLMGLSVVLGLVTAALVGLGLWITAAFLGPIAVGVAVGQPIQRSLPAGMGPSLIQFLIRGLVVVVVLGAIPFVGFLVRLAVLVLGLGAVAMWAAGAVRRQPQTA